MGLKMRGPLLATPDRSVAKVVKTADDFYGSREWKAFRAEIVRERGRSCERCGRTDTRPFVDHVKEKRDGGALLDKSNVMVVCGSCHTAKTAAVRAARLAR